MVDIPVLPYAGTSGFAATSDTSREAAEALDGAGVTALRQRRAMTMLSDAREVGITARELAGSLDAEFHRAAPALSVLHKAEMVSRLKERRGRYQVYVLPEFVMGRETSPVSHHGFSEEDLESAWYAGYSRGGADADVGPDADLYPEYDEWLENFKRERANG